MDLIILILLLLVVVLYFRTFESFVYFLVIVDILFRILSYLATLLKPYSYDFYEMITNAIPNSVLEIINTYSLGLFNTILVIGYIIVYILFEVYLIKFFFTKKRR